MGLLLSSCRLYSDLIVVHCVRSCWSAIVGVDDFDAAVVVDVAIAAVAWSAKRGGRGEGGTVPPITDVPPGNSPTSGQDMSGQDGDVDHAPYGPAALRFDGLPGLSVLALAGG